MITVTIQIGNSDDKLTQAQWAEYVTRVDTAVRRETEVHFFGSSPNFYPWQNVAWVIVADGATLNRLLLILRSIREQFNQDSIAWTQGETSFI